MSLKLHPSQFVQRLLPAACALCGVRCDAIACAACAAQFFGRDRLRCHQCGNPLGGIPLGGIPLGGTALGDSAGAHLRCGACLAKAPAFDATLVAGDYGAPLDQLVLRLKFGGQLALATLFAQLLRDAALRRPDFVLPTRLCPVPLGPGRLAERGFNQALEIARPLARMLGLNLQPTLAQRVRETPAQSRLAPGERASNIAHAFTVMPQAMPLVRGCHIGIVDDVMSSGQTLGELATTLKRFGAARVSNLVFARTPPH
jgi:ComF family protein